MSAFEKAIAFCFEDTALQIVKAQIEAAERGVRPPTAEQRERQRLDAARFLLRRGSEEQRYQAARFIARRRDAA